ncbi:MAG: sigma-70 family RNA polymerase sigma factor [Phycisphaerales bacterium]|nr:sigma-70 family RNA polymerase sigma factor [Phycisphaerales bacterium]
MEPGELITTTELLDGLRRPGDQAAWEQFDQRYRPILLGYLRRGGLDENDAADVAQETMTDFLREYQRDKYDRDQGRLRSWLIGIARNRVADARRRAARRREARGESAIADMPDDADHEAIWDAEQRRHILTLAVQELRDTSRFNTRTLEAFERVALRQEPLDRVSEELGLSPQEIYNAKNRVVERLREILQRYEAGFTEG